jgi:hypothetical protein
MHTIQRGFESGWSEREWRGGLTDLSSPYPPVMPMIKNRTTGCLFCGNEEGRFESEEHIIPLALGNTIESGLVEAELVIPPGEVCDKQCNGKRLSQRDNALVAWPPISVFRSLGQIRNRRGRFVDAVALTRWNLELDADDPRLFRLEADASTSPASGRDDVARALCKIAVETRWLEDPADARSSRWDPLAAAALGGPLPAGTVMGLTYPADPGDVDFTPEAQLLVDDAPGPLRLACQVWVAGLRLLLILGTAPRRIPNTAWWTLDPSTNSLDGPNAMWFKFRGGARSATKQTSPPSAERLGRGSQLPTHDERVDLRLEPSRSDE